MAVSSLKVVETGQQVAAIAHQWIGTPYEHQASCKGAGADCLGLLRGIWREIYGAEPYIIPAYSPDWAEADGSEPLLSAAQDVFVAAQGAPALGDVLILRMRERGPAKHLAILGAIAPDEIIHAYSGRGVVQSPLTPAWARRIAGRFRFPDRSI